MDKIVVDLDSDKRECVACGFNEARPGGGDQQAELPTRVSRASARRVETAVEVVTLLDPAADREDG
jgi:Zn ribbon nucleic-acid-binding protein